MSRKTPTESERPTELTSSDYELVEILVELSGEQQQQSPTEYDDLCDLFDDNHDEIMLQRALQECAAAPAKANSRRRHRQSECLTLPDDCLPRHKRRRQSQPTTPPLVVENDNSTLDTEFFRELGGKFCKQLDFLEILDSLETAHTPMDSFGDVSCYCTCFNDSVGEGAPPSRSSCAECGHASVCSMHLVECKTIDDVSADKDKSANFYRKLNIAAAQS